MDWATIATLLGVFTLALLVRVPTLRLPMDEDFATFTYIARFHQQGLRWQRDAFLFLYPVWRMILINLFFRPPEKGALRVRCFLAGQHAVTSGVIFTGAWILTENLWAATLAGSLYAIFGSAPTLEPESIHFEQGYLPFLLGATLTYTLGPDYGYFSALLLGLTIFTKLTTVVYLPVFALDTFLNYGPQESMLFSAVALAPFLLALAVDAALGYVNTESFRQMGTRMQTTLRCASQSSMWKRMYNDLKQIVDHTLPLWLLGIPSLCLICFSPGGLLWLEILAVTLAMVLLQRGYSRYHYLPWIGFLALGSGYGFNLLVQGGSPWVWPLSLGWMLSLGITFKKLWPFFFRPLEPKTLSQYGKFEQLLYLPYLGRTLHRLMRRRGESGQRLFVWGNFIQIYHDAGCPAADRFIHDCHGPWNHPLLANFFDSIIEGLVNHRPRYIILTRPTLNIKLLEQLTGLKYELMKVMLTRYPIYRLVRIQPAKENPATWTWQRKMEYMDQMTQGNHATGINALDVERHRTQKAMSECRKMLRLNPFDREGQIFLADLWVEAGQPQHGLSILQTLLSENPSLPGIRTQLARLHLRAGNLEQAEAFLQLEINKFGFNSATHLVSGMYHWEVKNYHQSIRHLETARQELTFNHDLLLPLAQACMKVGDLDQSRHHLETIRKEATTPSEGGLRTQACVLLAQLNSEKLPEVESLKKYALEDFTNSSLQYALASALEKNRMPLQALEIFTKLSQELDPGHLCAAAWFRRARLSESPNQKTMLESCLKMNPDHQEAQRMLNHLEVLHEST